MQATFRGCFVLALAAGCFALAWAHGSDYQREAGVEETPMPSVMVSSMREIFPH